MATSDPFNVVGGLTVGIPPVQVIDANGNVIANTFTANSISAGNAAITGNIAVGNVLATNYYYANGVPLPVGGGGGSLSVPGNDTEIVFNIGGNACTSPNLRFDPVVHMLHVDGNICIEGNVIGNYFYGDGSNLTNVSANTSISVTGNAQPNITSLGTLANLNLQGPGNLGALANLTITGGTAGQVIVNNGSNALVWSTGAPSVANGTSNVNIATAGGPVTISSGGTANVVTVNPSNVVVQGVELWVSGNVRANYFDGNGARLSSLNAANLIGAVLNAVNAGTVTTNAQPNITSVGTLTGITVNGISNFGSNGNVKILGGSPGQVLSTDGTGSLSWISVALSNAITDGSSSVRVYPNGNVTVNTNGVGNVAVFNEVNTTLKSNFNPDSNNAFDLGNLTNQWKDLYLSGTTIYMDGVPLTMNSGTRELSVDGNVVPVYDPAMDLNAPANITAVGNVVAGNLDTTGNLTVTGNANVGNIGAEFGVFIEDVSANNLSITSNASVTGNVVAGNLIGVFANGTSNVRIPVVNGNVVISAAGNANILTVTGVGANVTGNFTASNLTTSGRVVATGNIVGGNLVTTGALFAGQLSITGNVNGGNLNSAGNIEALGYVQAGNIFANLGTVKATVGNFTTLIGSLISGNQPNIFNVGSLSNLTVVGTATTGNLFSNSGTIRGNTVRANTFIFDGNVQGHLLPTGNKVYDLGSPTQRWKDIYLSNNTIFLGAAPIRSSGNNTITVPVLEILEGFQGNLVPVANATFSIGSPNAQWNFVGAASIQVGNSLIQETGNGQIQIGSNTIVVATPNGAIGSNSFTALEFVETANLFANTANIVDLNATGSLDVTGNIVANGGLHVHQDSSFDGNVTIAGNLTISGNVSYIDVVDLRVQDPVIQQGGGPNGSPLTSNDGRDRGQLLHVFDSVANTEVDKFQGWDNSAGEFAFGSNVTLANDVVTFNTLGNVRADTFIGALSGTAANATTAYALDTDVANITITGGSNGQMLTTDGTGNLSWQTISFANTGSNAKYVSKNGNDTTGDGSMLKPYLTITAAMNSITDAAPTKRYAIYVNAGEYNEGATLSLKPNVFVVGCDTFAVRIVATTFNMGAGNWSGTSDHRSGFSNCLMIGACDWNWATVTSGAGKLYFYDVQFSSTVNLYGHNNATAQAQFWSCVFFGAMTVSGINIGNHMNCRHFANITLNQHPGGGMATILNASGGDCSGTVSLVTTVTDFNRRCSGFFKSFYMGGLTVNGASSYADVTSDSLPSAGPTQLNGGNIVYLNATGASRTLNNLQYPTAVNSPIMPATTQATNLGDWGKEWNWTFSYIYGSTGSDLYVISYGNSYAADTVGRNIGIYTDGAGLVANVNGGAIDIATSSASGSGNSGNINITTGSVATGTRGKVNVTGDVVVTGTTSLGAVGNVTITGGSNGQFLQTNGSGVLTWATVNNVANANHAEYANIANTANLVVGGNVVGEVANANFASYSTTANVALSVSGANVSGEVANANYASFAGTAWSVSGANVSGEVANANYATTANTALNVAGANVSGVVANANYAAYADTVVASSQPNITSVGTLSSLSVSGQLTGVDAAFTGNLVVGGNLVYSNVSELYVTDPIIQAGGGPNGAPLTANDGFDRGLYLHTFSTVANAEINRFMGWSTANGEFIFSSNASLSNNTITVNQLGNIRANFFYGDGSGLSNLSVANATVEAANTANIANIANVAYSVSGSNVSGEVANANYATFAGTAYSVSGSNVSGEVANANYAQFAGTAGVANSVTGANVSGEVANANFATYSLYTNVANTANVATSLNANVANVNITGGVSGDVLSTDGTGNLSWVPQQVPYPGGSNTQVQFNVDNAFAGASDFTYDIETYTVTIGNLSVTSLIDLGDVANVRIDGGNSGYVLSTDGSGNLAWVTNDSGEPIANALIASTQYPMGFDESTKLTGTTISFDNATRTFTIAPTGATFDVWVKGTKYTKTTESVVTGVTTGAWYIYYTTGGALTASNVSWDIGNVAPVSYIYWNGTLGSAQMFFDERHGTTMDAATHEYLHRTRGASISTVPSLGFVLTANTTGTGNSNSDAEIGLSSGTFFDEDIQVDIVASPTPTPNTWEQSLTLPGQIPVLYRSGNAWVLASPTNFPVKFGTARPTYNLNTGGVWSTPDVPNNSYFVQWIIATNNLNYPVMSIMGQSSYGSLTTAQEATFADLDLQSLPIAEIRVLYGLVLQTSNGYTNVVKARIRSYSDIRLTQTAVASLTTNAVDIQFRETPQTVFDNDATAAAAWANYVGNYSGNINYTGSNVTLGNISNLHITGGSSGDLISTDGNGELSFVAPFNLTVGNLSASNGNAFITTFSNITTLGFDEDSGFAVDDLGNGIAKISINSTFKFWEVNGNPGLIAEGLDTVNFIAGDGVIIEANNNASPKTFTISASGAGGGNIGGSNTQIQYNDGGNFAGATDFTYNKTTGLVSISNTTSGATGIVLGEPSLGSLISNALSLTNGTSVSNSIALINQVLGKLVPPSPPAFPASQSISISSLSTYRMADFTQIDNTPGGNKNVPGGTVVTNIRRANTYNANVITTAGPGDSGTVTVYLNGSNAGSRTLTTALNGNGTYSNLVIFNNYDYNVANSSIAAGFWSVFSARAAGVVSVGWNEVSIGHSSAGNTNTPSWYYDATNPGTPQFSNVSIRPPLYEIFAYSSTVPHYDNQTSFNLSFSINRLSGDTYPVSDTFVTGTAGGAFQAPVSVTYAQAGIVTPLPRGLYIAGGSTEVTTTAAIITGFGSSNIGPNVNVTNSYNIGTQAFNPGVIILYKTGTNNAVEESNIQIGSPIGSGSGLAFRIINPGSTDTPTFSANAAAFNSVISTLETYDATIVAAALKHDVTNYSTGYLPVGPNLSVGRSGAQYFTFKFIRTSVSKFDIRWTGTIAGLWVALPGSTIDSTSGLNGWLSMTTAYAGAGVPGSNIGSGGNGSDGAALGGVAPVNSAQVNKSVTATFGTVSSSSTATNEIYVRIKLTAGQSVTALSLQTASN